MVMATAPMGRSGDREKGIWGTWEELLLACAVNRHGTASWDSVAMEVQSRSPVANVFTPQACRQRFDGLRRRFEPEAGGENVAGGEPPVPWLEEIRKLRVAELRREVESYDVRIVSLQLKVKRLKEERERSIRAAESGGKERDLKEEEEAKVLRSPGSTPDNLAGDRFSAGRSCKESNSIDAKEDDAKIGNEREDAVKAAKVVTGECDQPAADKSDNGSSAAAAAAGKAGESGESIAESKEETGKEGSEVQSSTGLPKRRGRRGRRRKHVSGPGGASAAVGDEQTAGEASAPSAAGQSPALMAFLAVVRSHASGQLFERRLESQDTSRYKNVIRRHVDLEMLRWKIERSGGAYTKAELYRDLLLLCANAVVYYPKGSPETVAAIRLREMVTKEIDSHFQKPTSPPPSEPPAPPPPVLTAAAPPPKVKTDLDIGGSLLEKSTSSMIACRKRSSIATKAAVVPKVVREEMLERPPPKEERLDDDSQAKKKTKERTLLKGVRGARSDKGGRGRGLLAKNAGESAKRSRSVSPAPKETPAEASGKAEKKKPVSAPARKRGGGGASSLAPVKRSSRAEGMLLESLKAAPSSSGRVAEQKKAGRSEFRKEKEKEQGGGRAKQLSSAERSLPLKRSVGRPPKRPAPPPPTPPPAKRAREEAAAPPSKPPPARKRGRR